MPIRFFSSQIQHRLHSIQFMRDIETVTLSEEEMSADPLHGNASRQLLSVATVCEITKQTQKL